MPSQEEIVNECDRYTPAPLIIFQIQTYLRLNHLESMVFNFIILNSLNIYNRNKKSSDRQWVDLSPTEFAQERGFYRQSVQEAIKQLIEYGVIISKEVHVQTNSGVQKGRQYCLISNFKLQEKYELLRSSAKPRGAVSGMAPLKSKKVVGAVPHTAPEQATHGTLASHTWHLSKPHMAPACVNSMISLENISRKDSLNNIKYFINTFSEFQNSFLELYTSDVKTKSASFKIEMKFHALIRQYGLFSTVIAMYVHLFVKDAQIGNFEALEAYLKENEENLKRHEENLVLQSDNLFNTIFALHDSIDVKDLKIFAENFRQQLKLLLLKMEFDQRSNEIFIYKGISEDIYSIFQTSNYNVNNFTKELVKKINMYFQSKLLGMKGLNFVQSLEH